MYILNDGIRLNAVLEPPVNGAEKYPLFIVIHGFTGDCEEEHIRAAARVMRECGYGTLRVDMYGHGKSDGQFRDHTLYKWITNALAVIDYAKALPQVTEINLCGHSQGGLLVMLAAALKRDTVRRLIPLSPAAMIPEQARAGQLLGITFDPQHVPDELVSWDDRILDGNYARIAQTIHVEEAIAAYNGPVLIVHGDADESVPFEVGEKAAAEYENAELARIPGDTHCFDYHLDLMEEAVRAWLIRQA